MTVRGKWTYLYRAVDKFGNTIDVYLSPTLTGDIRGEARTVERAFGIGPSALTEAVALLAQSLENHEAAR